MISLPHPHYSPDLAPEDFHLFPKMKMEPLWRSGANLRRCLTRKEDFQDTFQKNPGSWITVYSSSEIRAGSPQRCENSELRVKCAGAEANRVRSCEESSGTECTLHQVSHVPQIRNDT
ncbi:hypothetical protein C0J50_23541 [Silurus asotus]|uniref:Uncharacterized protein n=1 Tax=Silurus asotus TaxID=30991 RepID=A0AAD5AI12_SILAS|nr:hypothetical protein C0J50_23541 [Silurus asotus]